MVEEKRHTTLTEQDIKNLVDALITPIADELTTPEHIDRFASCFETRWRDYFYKGFGRGFFRVIMNLFILGVTWLSAYGMAKGWKIW